MGRPDRPRPLLRTDMWRLAVIGIAAILLWRLADIILLLFFAVLIATVLRGIADTIANALHAPALLMLTLVVIVFTVAGVAAIYWIGPDLVNQGEDLANRLSGMLRNFRDAYGDTSIGRALASQLRGPNGIGTFVTSHVFDIADFTIGTTGALFAVLVISIYFAAAPELYVDGVISLVPVAYRTLARRVMEETGWNLRRWLLGQLVDMVVVGGLSAIGLSLLGVPVPFALATLAGLLTIVPYIGAVAAGLVAVMVAFTHGWVIALWTAAIFVGCHVVEGYIVAPVVQHHLVRLPPALVIGAMTAAATLFGALGIVLGTPLAVATMVIVRRVYVEYILGDAMDTA